VKGRIVISHNPFTETMRYEVAWDPEGSSWKIDPPSADIRAGKGETSGVDFTAEVGGSVLPLPALRYTFTLGGEQFAADRNWNLPSCAPAERGNATAIVPEPEP
jgi:hypothetical protein